MGGFTEEWLRSHQAKMAGRHRAPAVDVAREVEDELDARMQRRRPAAQRVSPEMRVKMLAARRPVSDEVVLSFALPPSANRAWRGIEGGKGRVRSDDYKNWIHGCCVVLSDARLPRVEGLFTCLIEARRPKARGGKQRDIDNIIKPTLDLLHHTGMTPDDCKCMEVTARWIEQRGADGIVVVLRTWRGA